MLTVKFKTENAAFDDCTFDECARILRDIAKRLTLGYEQGNATDMNGNVVGRFLLTFKTSLRLKRGKP